MTVALVNKSTVATDGELITWATALQTQVLRDFAPKWHVRAQDVKLVTPTSHQWSVLIQDTVDAPGALGYHDVLSNGTPVAYIAAKTTLQAGVSIPSVISHEILEMLADPWINECVQIDNFHIWGYEVCDPVEQQSYTINGVEVSDFVLPAWFSGEPGPYDVLKKLTAARTLLPGGSYVSIGTATATGIKWSQKDADGDEAKRSICSRAHFRNRGN